MIQRTFFGDAIIQPPQTEGIKYAGSKLKLLPQILGLIAKTDAQTVLDGFSGSTRVSQALAQSGYRVTSNDLAVWSSVLATCYLKNNKKPENYQPLIDHLNAVNPRDGWFTEHYGGSPNDGLSIQDDGLKKPWQIHNTRKLDGIREEMERLKLDEADKSVALTSLMYALDEVDSTLGHFASYLAEWSPRSYKSMKLRVPKLFVNKEKHVVLHGDIFEAIKNRKFDLAYFDPPYGSNNEKMPPSRVRYQSYYHVWTTVCLNDRPELFGKAKRRVDTSDVVAGSIFEEFRRNEQGRFIATEAIDRLIRAVDAKYIILSYSSGGRATAEELAETLENNGTLLETLELDYKKNVMADMKWTNEWLREAEKPNREFLFLIEKTTQTQ
ncbi:MAG TPA: DNA methyltransferase [Planctomycetaceae bacterium]|nr:DNA methyltransferase [Planctomycetaceae bacterium]